MSAHHRRRFNCRRFLALAAVLVVGTSRAQADPMYTVTNLGQLQLPGTYDLNDSGEVVGTLANGTPILYQSSGPAAGTFTNLSAAVGANTILTGINDAGQILGNQIIGTVNPPDSGALPGKLTQAILYSGGQVTAIPMLSGTSSITATGINNSGTIIGYSSPGGIGYIAPGSIGYIYQNGQMTNLGSNMPTAIGNSGLVTGWGGYLYQNGQMMTGLPSGTGPNGEAINGSGEVVGSFWAPNGQGGATMHAFLYQDGHMVDLGALLGTSTSAAMGINSLGQVVGDYSSTSGPYGSLNRAFLYQNGTMTDLNSLIPASSGWFLTGGVAINNKGQILATGVGPDGSWVGAQDAFLLTPTAAPQVPEPIALAFFGLVAAGVALRRAWHRR